ncbi:exodeoxyribonuclease VII large subunit [Leptolyngbya sp. 7M]|uniref:exodeoxyribonuclease VII large subunit n=1 Tax=Leptolyngbya sp. 7M TaxID=2812896 RepID=UPI001B8D090B|nr:exodeoxyribonuclease VII large subunit [Leptolyngbya sp. 7M]QYO65798.1 exodeoxyribonuclease VII large subunit [Leptolyngbya sp. 7M]
MNDPGILNALFDQPDQGPSSVSELNAEIKTTFERRFANIWVEGEITGFHSAASGHWYFSLTDGETTIRAACFKGQNFRIRFKPSDGLLVRVRGRVTIYEQRSEYQIVVESLEPVGEGALAVAFEQIKARLHREGLFDQALKRPIPKHPRKIGVVTSPTGAALYDILTVLERRARSIDVVVVPTLVQGEKAPEQIVSAIRSANQYNISCAKEEKIDVLIVGRGGGSSEDLWAFNEEQVARAIRASEIPIISAVGHEIDMSIADLVADLRAPTPSAAAEIVARAEAEIFEHLRRCSETLIRLASFRLMEARTDLQSLSMAPVFTGFPSYLRELRQRVEQELNNAGFQVTSRIRSDETRFRDLIQRLSPVSLAQKAGANSRRLGQLEQRTTNVSSDIVKKRWSRLELEMGRLDAMSPLRVLDRGYSITQKENGSVVMNAKTVEPGELLSVRLAVGGLKVTVKEKQDQSSS